MEYLPYEDRLGELGLFNMENRKFQSTLSQTPQCSQLPRLLSYAINSPQIVKMASNIELHCDRDNIFVLRIMFYII